MKLFNRILSATGAVALLTCELFVGGCAETPSRPVVPAVAPIRLASKSEQSRRAAAFRKTMSRVTVRGVALFPSAFAGRLEPRELFERISMLGFNRIYINLTSEIELNDDLAAFVAEAGKRQLPIEVVISVRDFYPRHLGNAFARIFQRRYLTFSEMVGRIAEFNSGLPAGERISGIVAVGEVHVFSNAGASRPQDALFSWSENTYGIGLDNDMMMRAMFDCFAKLPALAPGLSFSVAMPDFYHECAVDGKLSTGRVGDFLRLASPEHRVIVRSGGNKPTGLFKAIGNELADAQKNGGKVLVEVNLARHTSVDAGALRRRDWNDLLRALNYLIDKGSAYESFGGVIIGPLAAIEFMRQELD